MKNKCLVNKLIEAVVTGSSERAGCMDDDHIYIKKLKQLALNSKNNNQAEKRLIKAVERLSAYGINLGDI